VLRLRIFQGSAQLVVGVFHLQIITYKGVVNTISNISFETLSTNNKKNNNIMIF